MTIILTVAYIDTSLFRLKFLSGAYDNLKNRRALRFLPKNPPERSPINSQVDKLWTRMALEAMIAPTE